MTRSRMDRADDLERLRLTKRRGDHRHESSTNKGRVGASLTIHWQRGGPIVWSTREPEGEALEALVLHLRPFLAPNGIGMSLVRGSLGRPRLGEG